MLYFVQIFLILHAQYILSADAYSTPYLFMIYI